MMDFRLNVFVEVARHLSFTKAARELFISQPAITKHIQELENIYKVQLFNRIGGKISLTPQGEIFLKHANEILAQYKLLANEMELVTEQFSGELKIGASTTIAQYLIAPLLADFIVRFPQVKVSLFTGNSEQIEDALENKKIDIGLVEGSRRSNHLKYSPLAKDELVLVTSSQNPIGESVAVTDIATLPLVLREVGSGTLEVIEKALLENGIKLSDLNILLHIGTTEGIKNFLKTSKNSYAIVSIISVLEELKNNDLKIVDIVGMEMLREFVFVTMQGGQNTRLERFMSFAAKWYSNSYK
ncbi:MAG: LysR family transcriptional regulator [Bacteroidales bacterium]|nr:LysR family transcriptional regulator [Bacteroidales bacterium]MBQ7999261.1 LysR family transcriptional regulator [Bacteroidales bacterium]MBR1950097.1 LysR family transcriptional regulator [Bacteroidales bacterium]MBR3609758.1 LysR family transcriptional regulator [Bacteroidales bacterium]